MSADLISLLPIWSVPDEGISEQTAAMNIKNNSEGVISDLAVNGNNAPNDVTDIQAVDYDSDEENPIQLTQNPGHGPRKISEKRRQENAICESYILSHQQEFAKTNDVLERSYEHMTTAALSKTFQGAKKMTPREYQTELFLKAKDENSIVVLDTGTGKTFIAVLLMQHMLDQEVERRASGKPPRLAFFVVDKVALVFQQFAVLESNLGPHTVRYFHGDSRTSEWNKQFWDTQLEEARAIVCTADILYKCLCSAYIRMDQICLLIFDEAHHAKKNHAYARIIKDFYLDEHVPSDRPRILGMTASPVDARENVAKASAELERLLHSRIVTASNEFAPASVNRHDVLAVHAKLPEPSVTIFGAQVESFLNKSVVLRDLLSYVRNVHAELGPWCADKLWHTFLSQQESVKHIGRVGALVKTYAESTNQEATDLYNTQVECIQSAREVVAKHTIPEPLMTADFVSSKVQKLITILQLHFKHESDSKCIIFVDQRYKAVILADLLSHESIKPRFLRPTYLVGTTSSQKSSSLIMSYREMLVRIRKVDSGEFNCVVTTSVAEEGLDLPSCNIIMRFDLYRTLIQYVQSRGRARQEESFYYHFVEKGNYEHRNKVLDIKTWERELKNFCTLLPEKRLKPAGYGTEEEWDDALSSDRGKVYKEPSTGATLNFKSALETLANFVCSLPRCSGCVPEYTVLPSGDGFIAEVLLPEQSPIRRATGEMKPRKSVAKCSAAFEMCFKLRKANYLDEHFKSSFVKQLPAMKNARLALSSKKSAEYNMRVKPNIWAQERRGPVKKLYMQTITFDNPDALDRTSRPLALLTREALPNMPNVQLFFANRKHTDVNLTAVPEPYELSADELKGACEFTLRLFDDIFSKEYEAEPEEMPYFLLPLSSSHDWKMKGETVNIDWDIVRTVQSTKYHEWRSQPDSFFENKFIVDPGNGARKLYTKCVRKDLKPTDPVPDWMVPPSSRIWKLNVFPHDIRHYSNSLWSRKSLLKFQWEEDQPVIEAELASLRRNLLDDYVKDEVPNLQTCYIVPQALRISVLPTDVVASAYCFPAIIHRIESILVALDGCRLCQLDIRPDLALEAFTKDSQNTSDSDAEQINFQGGMGRNYERLEFLGDSFLKMSTTIAVFTQMPEENEFEYHVERMLLLCNRNLQNTALELGLQEYVRSRAFDRRCWYPSGLKLKKGKRAEPANSHKLSDKSVADVCEAVIGAAYLTTYGNKDFDMAAKATTVMTRSKIHSMDKWEDHFKLYKKPNWQLDEATANQVDLVNLVEKRLGYKFQYPRLLCAAFTHPSYTFQGPDRTPSYQRLEFLGDALYDMVCVDYLFFRFPEADPQWLTEHKMAMVANQFLGCLAVELGFHKYLRSLTQALIHRKTAFAGEITDARREAVEAAMAEGKKPDEYARNFWCDVRQPPKALPDMVEAYVGAMFVDSGYNYRVVQDFFDRFVQHYFEDMTLYDTYANKQPVTYLSNIMQQHFHCVEWRVPIKQVDADTVEDAEDAPRDGSTTAPLPAMGQAQVIACVLIHGVVICHGVAISGNYAKKAAAKKAMAMIELLTPKQFRTKFNCTCPISDNEVDLTYDSRHIDVGAVARKANERIEIATKAAATAS